MLERCVDTVLNSSAVADVLSNSKHCQACISGSNVASSGYAPCVDLDGRRGGGRGDE